ncbi:MAG TPA: hypothetical protein VHP32_01155 [Ignavibacteria bacterium]|nr:hypothetical protein [Ignavibacteria bacterium]
MIENANTNIVRKLLNQKSLTVILILYLFSAIMPFTVTVIWGWAFLSKMCLVNILIYCVSLAFGIVLTLSLLSKIKNLTARLGIIGVSIGIIIVFVFSYDLQITISKEYYLWTRQEKLNAFVIEIQNYKKISYMDGNRIVTNDNKNIKIKPEYEDEQFEETLSLYGIEPAKYFTFRDYLEELDILSFCKYYKNDKQICFLMNGFLDNSGGFIYSEIDEMPESSCRGPLKVWYKIWGNWYAFAGWS